MGLVTTTSRFCYIECDRMNCSRKIYQFHETVLRELAKLAGWANEGHSWACPACLQRSRGRRQGHLESKKSARRHAL